MNTVFRLPFMRESSGVVPNSLLGFRSRPAPTEDEALLGKARVGYATGSHRSCVTIQPRFHTREIARPCARLSAFLLTVLLGACSADPGSGPATRIDAGGGAAGSGPAPSDANSDATTAVRDVASTGGSNAPADAPSAGGGTGGGGATGGGGVTGKGGFSSVAGTTGGDSATSTGSVTTTGGIATTSGMTSNGGVTGTGGVPGTGGATSSGGVTGSDGLSSTGGTTSSGGVTGSGGFSSTGGVTGAGGSVDAGASCPYNSCTVDASPVDASSSVSCGSTPSGSSETKTCYSLPSVSGSDTCAAHQLISSRTCTSGSFGEWSSCPYDSCTVTSMPAPKVTSVSPTTGPLDGGNTLTISGSNFVAGAQVTLSFAKGEVNFGAKSCGNVSVVSSTQLTCLMPALAYPAIVDVAVEVPSGGSTVLLQAYTYAASPPSGVVAEFLTCMSSGEKAQLESDFAFQFMDIADFSTWSPYPYACDAPTKSPSRQLVYNALRLLKNISFTTPLPFTSGKTIYEFMTLKTLPPGGLNSTNNRVRVLLATLCSVSSVGFNGNYDYLTESNSPLTFYNIWLGGNMSRWYPVAGQDPSCIESAATTPPHRDVLEGNVYHPMYAATLLVHESYHAIGNKFHQTTGLDTSIDDMGAWAAQFYFQAWVSLYATNVDSTTRAIARDAAAEVLSSRFSGSHCPSDGSLKAVVNQISPGACP